MKFAFQSKGGPILSWARGYPPAQARGADCKSLGAYEYVPSYALPGSPENIRGMGGITDTLGSVQGIAGGALGAYHGYKRTKSIGWALVWGAAGSFAPLVTGVIALAQGFAKPKGTGTPWKANPARNKPVIPGPVQYERALVKSKGDLEREGYRDRAPRANPRRRRKR